MLSFLVDIFQKGGKYKEAIAILHDAVKLFPDSPNVYLGLGRALKFGGRFRRAREILRRALTKFPDRVELYLLLGETSSAAGLQKEAIKYYKQAISLDARSGVAHNNLAWLYINIGAEKDKVLDSALKAKELLPQNAQVLDTVGRAYFYSGDYEKALKYCEMARRARPGSAEIRYHLYWNCSRCVNLPV